MRRALVAQFDQYIKLNKKIPAEILASVSNIEDAGRLADTLALLRHFRRAIDTHPNLTVAASVGDVDAVNVPSPANTAVTACDPTANADVDVDSHAILARAAGPGPVEIKHVLIGWDALEAIYGGRMDVRAKTRTNAQAAALARELAAKLATAPGQIDAVMREHSEDPGSKDSAKTYEVNANAGLVVGINPQDYRLDPKAEGPISPLDGIAFQRHWESRAFELGEGGYRAPGQRLGDFLKGQRSSAFGSFSAPSIVSCPRSREPTTTIASTDL